MGHQERELCIAHVDAERGFSGGEVQVFLLMAGLRARGHRNVLVCPPGSRAEERARAEGFEVRTQAMRADLDLPAVLGLRRILKDLGPSVVHLHTGRATWLAGLAAAWCGLPALTTRRQDRRVKRNWRTRLIYARLTQQSAAISRAVAACLEAGGVDPRGIQLIPSCVDPNSLRPSGSRGDLRAAAGLQEEDFVLLVMAALVQRKGIDVLLRALADLRDLGDRCTSLWIAGQGQARAELEALARSLDLRERVRFLGQRSDKGDLLACCDVFCLPSRREGLGVAALEAMAAGRPLVASAVGGLRDAVVDGESGLLVPPGDVAALAGALARLRDDSGLRAALGAAGPARVARGHLPEQMVAAYESMYFELAHGVSL